MVIGTKTGYDVVGIGRNTVGLAYHSFLIDRKNPVIFRISRTIHLGFPALFIWAGPLSFFF
jgi:hypothetical protein